MSKPEFADLCEAVRSAPCAVVAGSGSIAKNVALGNAVTLRAPAGIVAHTPDELTLKVLAGTPVEEIHEALSVRGQRLRMPSIGTIGGAVATRRNGIHPETNATLPNTLLMARFVSGRGELVTGGGPTVKNVSGFDVNKILVGSWGVFALIVEMTLRVEPTPACSRWFSGTSAAAARAVPLLYRPNVCHDSDNGWIVCLEGHPQDVAEQAKLLNDFVEVAQPSTAEQLASLGGCSRPPSPVDTDPAIRGVLNRLKSTFDPDHKLNPHLWAEAKHAL
jgi:FAD/FMN-containing dehydrogenase